MTLQNNHQNSPEFRKHGSTAPPARPTFNGNTHSARPAPSGKDIAAGAGIAAAVGISAYAMQIIGIVIAIAILGGLVDLGTHIFGSGSSWKNVSCAQWVHDSYSQQQQLFNDMQSTYEYNNDNVPLSFGSLQSTCDEEGTATLGQITTM
jgi:hypothetical protein